MSNENKPDLVQQAAIEQTFASFGMAGDPLTVLSEYVTNRARNGISDLAIPAFVLMHRWGILLNRPAMLEMAKYIQTMTGYVGGTKDAVEMAKAISLYDSLKGVSIMGKNA